MASGIKALIAIILITAFIELFFIVNNAEFTIKEFFGVPYNPFVIYFYFTLLAAVAIGVLWK